MVFDRLIEHGVEIESVTAMDLLPPGDRLLSRVLAGSGLEPPHQQADDGHDNQQSTESKSAHLAQVGHPGLALRSQWHCQPNSIRDRPTTVQQGQTAFVLDCIRIGGARNWVRWALFVDEHVKAG
jgi:hypothetical protein